MHGNKVWLTPAEAQRLTGHCYGTFRRWAERGLVRCKDNPRKKGLSAWMYHWGDIKNVTGLTDNW